MWDKSVKKCVRSLEKEGGRTKFIGKNPMRDDVEKWEKAIKAADGSDNEQIYPLEEKTEEGLPEKIFEEEDRRMLYQAILRLDIKKREIIQMQYFGGMTQKEIAAVLHITLENVRVLAYRARKELKKYLEECRKDDSK